MIKKYTIMKRIYLIAIIGEILGLCIGYCGNVFAAQDYKNYFSLLFLAGLLMMIPAIFCVLEYFERNKNLKLLALVDEEVIKTAGIDQTMVKLGISAWIIAVGLVVMGIILFVRYSRFEEISTMIFVETIIGIMILCWLMFGAFVYHKRINGLYRNNDEQDQRSKRSSLPLYVGAMILYFGLTGMVYMGIDGLINYEARVPKISVKEEMFVVKPGETLTVDDMVEINCMENDTTRVQKGIEQWMLFDGQLLEEQTNAVVSSDGQSLYVGDKTGKLEIVVWASGVEAGKPKSVMILVE